ncbi:hypothetical protein, partial [Salmonella sp. s54925]|uniref:hypothetical protein n=1 Tax=Salmonella sp. s54925 TaxID=3159674 RepID=UPI00397FFE00
LRCRERYGKNADKIGEIFEITLGGKKDIDSVMVAVSRRMIKVTINKHTIAMSVTKNKVSGSKKEKIPYIVDAVFPIREETGFCSENTIQYKANGAMYRIKKDGIFKGGKAGSGYKLSAYMAPF